jgi:hypothetical protein
MRPRTINVVLAAGVGVALAYLYGGYALFTTQLFAASATIVGAMVLGSQFARLLAYLSVRRIRDLTVPVLIIYFSAEVFAIPVLVLLRFVFGDPLYLSLVREVVPAWAPAVLASTAPVFIVKLVSSVVRGERLVRVLPALAFLFGYLVFLFAVAASGSNLSNSGDLAVALISSVLHPGAQPGSAAGTDVAVAGLLVYISALLFSVRSGWEGGRNGIQVLVIAFLGGSIALASLFGIALTSVTSLYAITIPTVAIAGALVWFTRER